MRGIKARLLAVLLSVSILGMLVVALINILSFRTYSLDNIKKENILNVNIEAEKINGWLSKYIETSTVVSNAIGSIPLNDDQKREFVESVNEKDDYIFDIYIGYPDEKFIDGSGWIAPPEYKPTTREWYKLAVSTGKASYTEPYLDADIKKFVVTVSQPAFDMMDNKSAVVGVDMLLDSITELVNNIKTGKGGSAFLIDSTGTFLAHSNEKMRGTNIKDNHSFDKIRDAIFKKDKGYFTLDLDGEENIAFVESIKNTGWKLVITLPRKEITSKTNTIIFNALLIILGAAAVISIVVYIMAGNISNPIIKLYQLAVRLAKGDLTGALNTKIDIKRNDEIGKLMEKLNETTVNLREMVRNIRNSAGIVAGAANEISVGNEDLSQRTQEQVASLEETSSAIEELTATVKQNADNANNANLLSSKIIGMVEEGDQVLKQTIHSMEDATNSSKKINEIINVVNEIAFQTNLLALNAAVEAARAGEQGRGFAVVASEVRNLAQRSGQAAREIQDLIKDSVDKMRNSNDFVLKTGRQLFEINDSIKNMGQLISEIAAASKEQSIGIEEVNKAIMQMDQATQQNATLVEKAAASSETMKNEAQELLNLVDKFTVDKEG